MNNQVMSFDNVIHSVMPQFERISRSNNLVTWQEESQFAVQALQKNQLLQKCTHESIQNAVVNIAAVGLTLNPADGYAYLVPEYNKGSRAQECQLRISFKGLVKVATDSGSIKWAKAEIVKANDSFTYKGPCEKPIHEMNPFADRGDTVGVYCIAKTHEGDYLTDTMSIEEINKIKSCAKTQNVWNTWFDEMAKKAITKRASKQWPQTSQASTLNHAVQVINDTEGGYDPFAELEEMASHFLELLEQDDLVEVGKVWCSLDEKEQSALWTAKTKGGWFTSQEKDKIREGCTEYRKSETVISEQ